MFSYIISMAIICLKAIFKFMHLGGGLSPNAMPKGFSEAELYLDNSYPKKSTPTTEKATPIHMKSLPLHLVDSQMSASQSLPIVKLLEPRSGNLNKDDSVREEKRVDSNSTLTADSAPGSNDEGSEEGSLVVSYVSVTCPFALCCLASCLRLTCHLPISLPHAIPLPATCRPFICHMPSLYLPQAFPLPAIYLPFTCHMPSLYLPLPFLYRLLP